MRQVHYSVAMSLDGYIARNDGSYDWIIMDPDIDFAAMFARFDTVLMGRKTFEIAGGGGGGMPGMTPVVFSRTLRPADHPSLRIVSEHAEAVVAELKGAPGKDIWLMGGGELFSSLLQARLVDTIEVGLIPVVLGGGVPMLPPGGPEAKLRLTSSRVLGTGIVMLGYAVDYADR